MRSVGLAVALALIMGGCAFAPVPGGSQITPELFKDLAADPMTAAICIPPSPPYVPGFVWIRTQPGSSQTIECPPAKITAPAVPGSTAFPPGSTITVYTPTQPVAKP